MVSGLGRNEHTKVVVEGKPLHVRGAMRKMTMSEREE